MAVVRGTELIAKNSNSMKQPKTAGLLENSLSPWADEEEEDEGERTLSLERRPKRERRQSSVTLCKVCNIQLNSAAQAQIHYKGKTHQRRLRQHNKAAALNAHTGTISQANPLLASLSLPGRPLQPQLDLKHFLPLRVNGSTPLSLFPNFNTMDPVQKAVINHTFGVAQPKKKQIISCNICHLRFNSTNQAEAHYKGHKHARKLKAMDVQRNRQRGQGSMAGREKERDRERERGKTGGMETIPALLDTSLTEPEGLQSIPKPVQLELEDTQGTLLTPTSTTKPPPLNTSSPLPAHVSPALQLFELTPNRGTTEGPGPATDPAVDMDHPDPLTGQGDFPILGEEESKEGKKSPEKQQLHCPMCKVTVNSKSQLEAHYSGSKHKQMLEGQAGGQVRRRVQVMSLSRVPIKTKQLMSSNRMGMVNQMFHCKVCEVSVNSETQLKQHMSSRRHKDRLAGKPSKPKFSPYTKSQPNPVLATLRWSFPFGAVTPAMGKLANHCLPNIFSPQTKLALQKHLPKTLPAGFLASHLNPATLCTMASSPLTLRPSPSPSTIIQTPLLSPALFRPAPGPLRAMHAPIIFSPY
ncbi:zinc finger protein 385C-like isoform X2 [Osmerus eperlanus]|uniref:zinc finger protein 385C-like isoform X2 n=1 Tax=Osmerus eperlanus TaxID=29151 RepID=UPI002E164969